MSEVLGSGIDIRHGIIGTADHSMAADNEFSPIEYVVDNFDNAETISLNDVDEETAK